MATLVLLAEKVIQHVVVTAAFAIDLAGIRDTVAIPWVALAAAGVPLALLYALAFRRYRHRRPGARALVAALALIDVVGEFVAQGTPAITVNMSFLVALLLLALVVTDRRGAPRAD
ncbi:MAG: hypothetical protein WEB13_03855 [Dehalococcoidia bacterium]